MNTSVRQKEMIAETFPLESAVKKPEEAILIPLNRKLTANSGKPLRLPEQRFPGRE